MSSHQIFFNAFHPFERRRPRPAFAATAGRRRPSSPSARAGPTSGEEHGVGELRRAEPHGIVGGQARLLLRRGDRRARGPLVEQARVERDRRHLRRPRRQRQALVQLDELGERRDRVRAAAGALDLGAAGLVAEHEQVRDAAVVEPERDARVDRVQDRPLALDPQQLAAALGPFDDEPLGGARDEVRDDGVDRDPPAGDRDPGLAGRHEQRAEAARARLEVELERDGHLPDRAVGADGEDDRRRHARGSRPSRSRGRAAAGAGRAARPRAAPRARASSGSSARKTCSPFSTSSPCAMQTLRMLDPRGREAAALRGDADERGVRLEARARPRPCGRSGTPSSVSPARAPSRGWRRRRRAGSAARRASSCRSARRR